MAFDPNVDMAALTTEFTEDPSTLYGGLTTAEEFHAALNLERAAIQLDRGPIPVEDIVAAIQWNEYVALSADQKSVFLAMTQAGELDFDNANVRNALAQIFDAPTAPNSRAALIALQKRNGSRAEELFGASVSLERVREALS